MKMKESIPHGEEGHIHYPGCEGYAKGGKVPTAGIDDVTQNPSPEPPPQEGKTAGMDGVMAYAEGGMVEEKDPSEIPEHIREFVENAHKERRESRPDENWRIKAAETPDSIAPYKRDEDEMAKKPSILDRLKGMGLPKMSGGGDVGGFDVDGGDSATVKMAGTPPSIAPDPVPPADPVPVAPPVPAPAPAPAAATPKVAPDFMGQANKTMNLSPEQQVGFMKLLGDNAQKSQIGAGIAGIGDAIASGGTLGKVNPGALNKSEELIQGRTKEGLEGMETIRGNAPFDPAIQKSLVTQFHIPPALAGAPRDVIYKMLDPIAQTQLKEAELAAEQSYKKQALDLQKKQIDATIGNQQAERRATDVKNKIEHPLLSAVGAIPSVVGAPEGRITVISPSGQVGHIPESQLKTALAKGYKQQ